MDITNKRFCIIGLGISGYETAVFLNKHKASVFVTEQKISKDIEKFAVKLRRQKIECEIGGHNFYKMREADIIVVSPGVPPRSQIIEALKREKKKMISEIELASWFYKGTMIGVTGTNGKTTVTTLIAEALKNDGRNAKACGNIGNPFISIVDKMAENSYAVIELSSFQLYYSQRLRLHIGIVLNVAPDHFDWHTGMDEYVRSKCKIFRSQTAKDVAVINHRERNDIERYIKNVRSRKVYFNKGNVFIDPNFDCMSTVANVLGVKEAAIKRTVKGFKGIEHRMEFAGKRHNVTFINDSKSTSPHSLEWALKRCKDKVVLICGGKNKGVSFEPLRESVTKKVKALVAMGECQQEIEQALGSCVPTARVNSLKEAIITALKYAQSGDTILFSPACASFDMFKNYKDRGKKFKGLVARV
ncbi:MAG: UDP-N-acetylmuramoyl-L-alanine--D-glutamate ligase [Candidatus Omnitrophica bacterium]|nr:UDP-N-acetylmuramoyl-L-alanine--D-glutamate ligase [Candidatus Omnitrophota bacterium]